MCRVAAWDTLGTRFGLGFVGGGRSVSRSTIRWYPSSVMEGDCHCRMVTEERCSGGDSNDCCSQRLGLVAYESKVRGVLRKTETTAPAIPSYPRLRFIDQLKRRPKGDALPRDFTYRDTETSTPHWTEMNLCCQGPAIDGVNRQTDKKIGRRACRASVVFVL